MTSEHRKIELQSPADLTHLQTQIRHAARQKLDLHLPPVTSGTDPDDLRRKTEDLVDIFVARVLEGMRQNISINGMDVVDNENDIAGQAMEVEVEEYEDLDGKLREKLRGMVARRDALIAKIAQHRRVTPGVASKRWREEFEREMEVLENARGEMDGRAGSLEGREQEVVGEGLGLKRQGEVERTWERAVEGLDRLNKGLPETRARLERAGEVVGYLEGKDKGV